MPEPVLTPERTHRAFTAFMVTGFLIGLGLFLAEIGVEFPGPRLETRPAPTQTKSEYAARLERDILRSIAYEPDVGEYWKTPAETLASRTGDCEDLVILFLDILAQATGDEGILVVMSYPAQGSGNLHAEARFGGKEYFIPQTLTGPELAQGRVIRLIPYREALKIAEESRPRGYTRVDLPRLYLPPKQEPRKPR